MTARQLVTKTESPSLEPTDNLAQALQTRMADLSRLNNDLNQLLEDAGIGAIFVDPHMRILRFTATASQLINLIPSDVGRTLDDIVTNLIGSDHLVVDVQAVLDTQTPRNVQVQTAAGLWFESRIRPYRTLEKVIEGAVITFVDITELKRMEQALRKGEEHYRAMVEWSPEAINVVRDGLFVYVNPAAIQMYGARTAQDLLGTPTRDRVHPDDYQIALGRLKLLTHQHVSAPLVEMRFLKLDGTVIEVQAQAKEIDYDGAPAIHVAWRDIAERKRAQIALRDSEARMQMADQVLHLAFYDALTNLPNRRVLNDRLNQTMITSKRNGCYGALMFLDLDNFKSLNDTHGHEAGDLLLIEVAQRLKNCVREMDTVARFGGDEFVVMLSKLSADKTDSISQAKSVAEKISVALSDPYQLSIKQVGKVDTAVEHRCTASIGVALFINNEASHVDILKWADTAMYLAKKAGHNLIRFHDGGD